MMYAYRVRASMSLLAGLATISALMGSGCQHPESGPSTNSRRAALTPASPHARAKFQPLDPRAIHPVSHYPLQRTEAEWAQRLTPAQVDILRRHGTERPWSSKLVHNKDEGTYACAGCGQPLFASQAKYESGTGWPSFYEAIAPQAVGTAEDTTLLAPRVEVHCSRCRGHLGHVFEDGPAPTGLRYCINGTALDFVPASHSDDASGAGGPQATGN